MPIVSPDQVNQQKQMLENAAQLAHQREGVNLQFESKKMGSKKQLITTVIVLVVIVGALVLLSRLGIL